MKKQVASAIGIPIVLGFKKTVTDRVIIAAEVGARYTFSDEIDGSEPDAIEHEILRFGNFNNNDWYVFSGFNIDLHVWKKTLLL